MPSFSTTAIHQYGYRVPQLPTSVINAMTPQQNVEAFYAILGTGAQQYRTYKFLTRRNLPYYPPVVPANVTNGSNGSGVSVSALAARYNLNSVQNVQFRVGW